MPLTFAHPAAVLPLMRRPFDALALVCGAMAPDIPYFVRSTPLPVTAQSWYEPFTNATTSHSIAGLLSVTLPLALAMYLVLAAARPAAVWLTRSGSGFIAPLSGGGAPDQTDGAASRLTARWAWIAASLLVGALTHLIWDSFTNSDGPLATRVDALNDTVLLDMTWARVMQQASTIIGLAVLAIFLWRRRGQLVDPDPASRRRVALTLHGLVTVGLIAGAVSVVATFDHSTSASTPDTVESILSNAVKGGGAAVGITVVVATGLWWLSPFRARQRQSRIL